MKRRAFLRRGAAAAMAAGLGRWSRVQAGAAPSRKMTIDLTPGAIGIRGNLPEIVDLAHRHGFESVAPSAGALPATTLRIRVIRVDSAGAPSSVTTTSTR